MFKEQAEESELTLEDYSLEELEYFMMSEEFEQLDELDKSTLKSYFEKSQKSSQNILKKAQDPKNSSDVAQSKLKGKFTKRLTGMARAVQKFNKEETEIDEAAGKVGDNHLHVQEVKHEGKTKYKVHAVGKNFADGIKVGEHLSDTELDDFQEMGGKVKHVK